MVEIYRRMDGHDCYGDVKLLLENERDPLDYWEIEGLKDPTVKILCDVMTENELENDWELGGPLILVLMK